MIGSLIGGGLNVLGGVWGAIEGRKSAKRQRGIIDKAKASNQAWYNKNYNERGTQRRDSQEALELMRKRLDERGTRDRAVNTVMGGTEESEALSKQANTMAMSDATSRIDASMSARKDQIEGAYMGQDAALTDAQLNMEQNKAKNIAAGASQLSQGAAGIVGSIFDTKKVKKEED